MATQKFLKLPQNFLFFFQSQLEFHSQTIIFRKKLLRAKFDFFVHNVALDALMLDFFPFYLIFFSKALKKPFFVRHAYLCLVQFVII